MEEEVGEEDALDLLLNLIETQEKAEQQQQEEEEEDDEYGFILLEMDKIPLDMKREQDDILRSCPFARGFDFEMDPNTTWPWPPSKKPTLSEQNFPRSTYAPRPTAGDVNSKCQQLKGKGILQASKKTPKDDVEIVDLTSDDEEVEERNSRNSQPSGSEATLKRSLPFSMTGKGAWDQIYKYNRGAATGSSNCGADGIRKGGNGGGSGNSKGGGSGSSKGGGSGNCDGNGSDSGNGGAAAGNSGGNSKGGGSDSSNVRGESSFLDFVCRAYEVVKREDKDEETAIKRGFKIPRPSWWPPEGFNQ